MFSSVFPSLRRANHNLPSHGKDTNLFLLCCPLDHLNSPAYHHNLVRRDLDPMQVSSVIIHYTDDLMIMSETEEQARTDFNGIVTHMTNLDWLINPAKAQAPVPTVRFLGITQARATWDIPQVTKNKLLSLPNLRTKQDAQHLVGLFGYWRMHIPQLGILSGPISDYREESYI